MNRRTFISICLAGFIAGPILVRALATSTVPARRVFLHHDEYATKDVFQLSDLNTLFIRWRRVYGDSSYTTLKLGRMEDEHFGSLCWHVSHTREGAIRYAKMTERERYLESPEYWGDQWKCGNRFLPWQRRIGEHPRVEIVDAENWCELS